MSPSPSRLLVILLGGWCIVALLVGASGQLGRAPVPPPAIALLLAGSLSLLIWLWPAARHSVRGLGTRPLVAFHLVRLIAGAYFLLLYQRGLLPREFAVPAGWGDIGVGLAAVAVWRWCIPLRTRRQQVALLVWNTVGLIEILAVLTNGARLFLGDPDIGGMFAALPLSLLPTFVVPIVLVTHVLLFTQSRPVQS